LKGTTEQDLWLNELATLKSEYMKMKMKKNMDTTEKPNPPAKKKLKINKA